LALMNAARGYKDIHETEAAIDALDRMINTYPRSVLTPDAYLKIAQTHASLVDGPAYDQASTKNAITYYEDYMILFPGDASMATAEKGLANMKKVLALSKMTLADYYFKYRHNYQGAKVFYNEAITVYPGSEVATQARAKLVLVEAKLEQQSKLPPKKVPPPEIKKKKKLWLF
jgi:outer membrane protein assembly factor BamD